MKVLVHVGLVVVVRVHTHGLVCPGVVDPQRYSAAVEAAAAAVSAAVCRPLTRA